MNLSWRIWLLIGFLMLAHQPGAHAIEAMRVSNNEQLSQALREATAGTRIEIAPGIYQGGLARRGMRGTKEAPIVLAGADPANPPVIQGGASGLHLSAPEYVELRDLEFAGATGNGINIDDSGSADTPARHVIMRNIFVRDVGPAGNRDGIKLSGVSDFLVEGCRVRRWGSSGSAIDMVGCRNGIIQTSTFVDAGGDFANGVQAKGGSREIVIRRCRFEDAGGRGVNIGGSTGLTYFRPRVEGYEAKNITVEDCEFLGGVAAVAFVGVDGALVHHNTIYRPRRWAVRILQENVEPQFVPCRNGRFQRNVVVFRADECRQVINIGGQTSPETFEFSGNLWYCLDRPQDTQRLVRLPVQENLGSYDAAPQFENAEKGNVRLPIRGRDQAGARFPAGAAID